MLGTFWTTVRYALRPVANCCSGSHNEPLLRRWE